MTETILRKEFIMKRTLSIILCLVMVLSLVAVSAYAAPKADEVGKVASGYTPEGTGIASLAEATDPAGKYYLKNDITVSATIDVAFAGTIDGNGKTITVSAPIFNEFNGTFKNAVIAGAIDESAAESTHVGTVSRTVGTEATFENVKNTATVKAWLKVNRNSAGGLVGYTKGVVTFKNCANTADINGYCAGGLIGHLSGSASAVYAEGCTNSGNISDTGTVKVSNAGAVGGLVGLADSTPKFSFKDCHNTGNISGVCGKETNTSNTTTGGILGYNYMGKDKNTSIETSGLFENVSNTGTIEGTNQVGGICGFAGATTVCKNAVNKGNVTSTGNYAGGIFSRAGGDATKGDAAAAHVVGAFENCENYGKVVSYKSQAAGILAYTAYGATAVNCINKGEIDMSAASTSAHVAGIFGSIGYTTKLNNCFNYAKITGTTGGGNVGGLVGRSSITGKSTVLIEYSANFGDVKALSNASAAGISSYVYGGSDSSTIRYCYNTGKIESTSADSIIAGATAYYNTANKFNIQYFFNAGELVLPAGGNGYAPQIAYNKNATLNPEGLIGNYYLAGDGKVGYVYNVEDIKTEVANTYTAAELKSGALAYALNDAIGQEVFKQTLGTDATPAFEGKSVIKNADGTFANPAPVTPSKPTGDMTVVIFAIMVLTVGSAVVIGKKISVR